MCLLCDAVSAHALSHVNRSPSLVTHLTGTVRGRGHCPKGISVHKPIAQIDGTDDSYLATALKLFCVFASQLCVS